jgi:hypothetical protein
VSDGTIGVERVEGRRRKKRDALLVLRCCGSGGGTEVRIGRMEVHVNGEGYGRCWTWSAGQDEAVRVSDRCLWSGERKLRNDQAAVAESRRKHFSLLR